MNDGNPSCLSSGAEETYFSFIRSGQWKIQRCRGCSGHVFYPRQMCPHCYGSELEWVAPSGRGTVYSFSQVAGRNGDGPVVLLVDLDEGVRIMGGAPAECAHELRIGSRVKGALIAGDGGGRIVFELERQ